ncbi:hypothetical protein BU16DRAFT_564973 [Lophium mytilinum]|uniref:RING-type domain-containing protein n=1 Tax=Lophium mytilinum TaxID=390894 RepID=A0A6A6QGW3_9PEZI|nr:hypothetical protein BU16DRAFT_564973 [Lophium mytilinum]
MSDRANQHHLRDFAADTGDDDIDSFESYFTIGRLFCFTKILHLVNKVDRSEWQAYVERGYDPSLSPDALWVYKKDHLRTHLPDQYQPLFDLLEGDEQLIHTYCDETLCEMFAMSMQILTWKRQLCRLYNEPWIDPVTADTSSLPVIVAELEPADAECSICREPFSADDPPVKTFCGHILGRECFESWLQSGQANQTSCPVCRQDFEAMMPIHRRPGTADPSADYADIVAMFSTEAQAIIKNIERVFTVAATLEQSSDRVLLEVSTDLPRSEEYMMVGDSLQSLNDDLNNLQDALMHEMKLDEYTAGALFMDFMDYDDGDSPVND